MVEHAAAPVTDSPVVHDSDPLQTKSLYPPDRAMGDRGRHSSSRGLSTALKVRGVSKRYRGATQPAVDNLTFSVDRGEVVGLLGANGAGKSTTIGMIATRIPIESGDIYVNGASIGDAPEMARGMIGVTGQSNTLDGACSVFENLYLHCRYHGMPRRQSRGRSEELLESFDLWDKRDQRPETLSGGFARRLQLARSMAHAPQLLLLDEPTNELDVPSRYFFWQQIEELRERGDTAVLLATHLLDEAEEHCDRVIIVDSGRLVLEGPPASLRRKFRGSRTLELTTRRPIDAAARGSLERFPAVVRCSVEDRRLRLLLDCADVPLHDVTPIVHVFGVEEVATRIASLREIFLDSIDAGAWRR
jgi:ABC-2 type transport system ATP-binding protein